jgi:hypothetical protein
VSANVGLGISMWNDIGARRQCNPLVMKVLTISGL